MLLKNKISNWHYITSCALACFPLLGMHGGTIAIAIFGIISIAAAIVFKFKVRDWNWKSMAPFGLLFGLIAIRTLVGNTTAADHFYLEKSMSLLVLPLFFAMLPFPYQKKDIITFQLLFAYSTVLMGLIGMAMTVWYFNENIGLSGKWHNWNELFSHPDLPFFIRTAFEEKTSFHPTYACLYLGIALNIFLFDLLTTSIARKIRRVVFTVLLMLVLLLTEILLASRTPFVATFIGSVFIVATQLKNKKMILPIIFGIAFLGWEGSKLSPSISGRMKEVSMNNVAVPKAGHEDSFNLRRGILHCTFEIIKGHWIWGVGPGKVQDKLDECYADFDQSVYKDRYYNTHNQYLDYWAGLGLLGPMALIGLLAFGFRRSFKSDLPLGMTICVLFSICMLTENLLLRQYGIVAFSYFLCLYSFNIRREKA